jgi:hypothetical protein
VVSLRTLLMAFFFLSEAYADRVPKLRIQELPSVHQEPPPPPSATRVLPIVDENARFERAVWVLTMRAQQLADPHGRVPAFLPILGTQVIGGSLRLDF